MMPFDGGIESLPNGTLLLSVAAAVLYLPMQAQAPSWRRSVAKTAAVALLGVLAFLEGGPVLLIAGLVLSAAGDAFLAQRGERFFLGGLASFLLTHVAYIALFVMVGDMALITGSPARIALAVIVLAVGVVLSRLLLPRVVGDMKLPVAIYMVAILAMGITALTIPSWLVVAGAFLFIASDAILAIQKFILVPDTLQHRRAGPAVWVLYYLAQLCFTLAFLL